MSVLLLLCSYFTGLITLSKCGVKLQILHVNDLHSRFEETSRQSGVCRTGSNSNNSSSLGARCYGGFARLKTAADDARRVAQRQGYQSIFLNAGDNFQGTPYYSLFKWKVVAPLVEALGFDAMTLGNHEFDDGVAGVVPFINNVSMPLVVCNINTTIEPRFRLNNLKPSVVLTRGAVRIGVVGYLTPQTKALADIKEDMIMDEMACVAEEARRLKRQQNCTIVIGLGHSGIMVDKLIAEKIPEIDVIVGGHSHTFLYTGKPPDIEESKGDYPTVVRQSSGKVVPIVHAYAYAKYLGNVWLDFADNGTLISYGGNPILLDTTIQQDKKILQELESWKRGLHNLTQEQIGKTMVALDGHSCRLKECNLGNLATDAFVYVNAKDHTGSGWTDAPIAMLQGGGIRSTVDYDVFQGNLTVGEIMTAFPFENIVLKVEMPGQVMWDALERSVSRYDKAGVQPRGEFLQVSGLRITYDTEAKIGSRVKSVLVRCGNCSVPIYQRLDFASNYTVITTSFLMRGADGYSMLAQRARTVTVIGGTISDAVIQYIKDVRIVCPEVNGRIYFVGSGDGYNNSSCRQQRQSITAHVMFSIVFVIYILLY